jgi:hypothetical protein
MVSWYSDFSWTEKARSLLSEPRLYSSGGLNDWPVEVFIGEPECDKMSDRPDWLPDPDSKRLPGRPIGERVRLAATSVASLALLALGLVQLMLAVTLVIQRFSKVPGASQQPWRAISAHIVEAAICIAVAYLMRWCLYYARIGLRHSAMPKQSG